jgi:hypothetical protein
VSDSTEEAQWRAEFELRGEWQIRDRYENITPEPKRQFAIRWLRDQERARIKRDQQTFNYVRWTFWAAVGAVIIGIIGVVVTVLH